MAVKKKMTLGEMVKAELIKQELSERWLSRRLGDESHSNLNYFIKKCKKKIPEERLQKINELLRTNFKQQ